MTALSRIENQESQESKCTQRASKLKSKRFKFILTLSISLLLQGRHECAQDGLPSSYVRIFYISNSLRTSFTSKETRIRTDTNTNTDMRNSFERLTYLSFCHVY